MAQNALFSAQIVAGTSYAIGLLLRGLHSAHADSLKRK